MNDIHKYKDKTKILRKNCNIMQKRLKKMLKAYHLAPILSKTPLPRSQLILSD